MNAFRGAFASTLMVALLATFAAPVTAQIPRPTTHDGSIAVSRVDVADLWVNMTHGELYEHGKVERKAGNHEMALRWFRRAAMVAEDDPNERGHIYIKAQALCEMELERWTRAHDLVESVLKAQQTEGIGPVQRADTWILLGRIQTALGNHYVADFQFDRALFLLRDQQTEPVHQHYPSRAHYWRGDLVMKMGYPDMARADFAAVVKYGEIHLDNGYVEAARERLTKLNGD